MEIIQGMPTHDDNWPLWEYACDEGDLFKQLDDPDCGIALVRMQDGINPQGLVDTFAKMIRDNRVFESEELANPYVRFHSAKDLIPLTPGFLRESFAETNEAVQQLAAERQVAFSAIGDIATRMVRENSDQVKTVNVTGKYMIATGMPEKQGFHTDINIMTAFIGATAHGHVMKLPEGNEFQLSRLPEEHVLFTRQRFWGHLGPHCSPAAGIEHCVDFKPNEEEPVRAVAFLFVGK